MKWLLGFSLLLAVPAFALEVTPTEVVQASMDFQDDLDFMNLPLAIDRQLENYKIRGLAGTIKFGTKVYPRAVLKDSLLELKALAAEAVECLKISNRTTCEQEFSLQINKRFNIYRPIPKSNEVGFHR